MNLLTFSHRRNRSTALVNHRDQQAVRRRAGRRRPDIENLECRALLSTMYVDDDWADAAIGDVVGDGLTYGTDAFSTIPAAIARAADGDDIQIAEGTYSITSVINIGKKVDLIGAGAEATTLDVSTSTATYGLNVRASDVTLSGFRLTGSTSNSKLRYGIYASGVSGLSIDGVAVDSLSGSGVNLIGTTDVTITNVTSRDNNGAGFFFTDVKGVALTDVQTRGNAWTGVGFSTSGRYFDAGVEGVVIEGSSRFGEVASDNGGVMFEEARWDTATSSYAPGDPVPISFSTDPTAGADVTFSQDVALPFVLTGPQDDAWPVRRRFYESIGQGVAALNGTPDHFQPLDRVLSVVGPFAPPLVVSGPATVDQGSAYTLTLTAGAEAGPITFWRIDWGDGAIEEIAGSSDTASHNYSATPNTYQIRVWAETAVGPYEAPGGSTVTVLNVAPVVAIAGAPASVDQGTAVHLAAVGSDAEGEPTYAWAASLGGATVAAGSGPAFDFAPTAPGDYLVTLTAVDAHGAASVAAATISVLNVAPVVAITPISGPVNADTVVTLTAQATDPNPLVTPTYAWTVRRDSVVVAQGQGATLGFTPLQSGLYEAVVEVSDGEGGQVRSAVTFSVVSGLPATVERAVES